MCKGSSFSTPERLLLSPIDLNMGFIRAGEIFLQGEEREEKKRS